jgi:predicted DNA-binding mobile mystery protein A
MKGYNELKMTQIQSRLDSLNSFKDFAKVRPGWISYMRGALGMTLKNLAKILDVSIPTVAQSERREMEGKVTLETLRKMATAMECEFVYAFIPRKDLKTTLEKKAFEKARTILKRADTHMTLENQKVEGDINKRIERLAKELLEKGDVW